ncbi:glycine-rich RNA-binding protein RZ1C isoform X1 [Nymphaea colorata]|nr:glycine-rich RNA-binding protein RZ1C isoform X1 [Nymphaea colorata]XP_031486870.1 glycine-rich RNA-binding protein RZ1C isoform X1 [Nymphaea colorata]XP_049933708.1 glycine-rich RNA-binding protein RZ1C isoform X1 [Nymphaea colorata]
MAGKEDARIFVGGLAWETTDRQLADTFSRFGKVLDAQVMLERGTNRPRGFGFVTFSDRRAVEAAIDELHGRELNGRIISVNRAEPKLGESGTGYGGGGSGGGSRGSYGGGDRGDRGYKAPVGRSECFKCGRPGHWARECPSAGGGDEGRFSSRSRYAGGRGDRFGGDRYGDRYGDDRYDGGRYGDRDRIDGRDSRYGGRDARDRYPSDKYPTGADRFNADRYGAADRYPQNGYNKDRGYEREGGRSSERYGGGGGPTRYEGSYRDRPGPYDRPARGRPPSFEDRY